jgi:hypothetical protein
VRGTGTWDELAGSATASLSLAPGIPEDITRSINLGYFDPAEVDPMAWAADPDTLVVPDAGEDLYKLR